MFLQYSAQESGLKLFQSQYLNELHSVTIKVSACEQKKDRLQFKVPTVVGSDV